MNKFYTFIIIVLRPFFFLFHPYRAIGNLNLPEGGAVLCANHSSASDPFFVAFALAGRAQLRIMAKAELLRIPIIGWLLKKAGIFGVERGKSDVKAIKEAIRCLKNGEKLLIFPEGTRIKEGEESQAKNGAAMLAMRTGVPIIPIWMPAKKGWFFRRTPVIFGDAFYPEAVGEKAGADDYIRVADDTMQRITAMGERAG